MKIIVNGSETEVSRGDTTVSAALLSLGLWRFRTSVTGTPRAPLCGMGICFECRVTVDGISQVRSCMTACREGMSIETDEHD